MICIFGLVGVFVFSFVSSARNYIYLASNVQLFFERNSDRFIRKQFYFLLRLKKWETHKLLTRWYMLCVRKKWIIGTECPLLEVYTAFCQTFELRVYKYR